MEKKSALTPQYGRFLIWLKRPFPDFDFSFIKPVRRWTVELLDLKPGDRVRDVGCRAGGSSVGEEVVVLLLVESLLPLCVPQLSSSSLRFICFCASLTAESRRTALP